MKPATTMKLVAVSSLAVIAAFVSLNGCQPRTMSAKSEPVSLVKSKTDQTFSQAEQMLARKPDDLAALLQLGGAAMQKGRETGDLSWYVKGRKAFEKAVSLYPDEPVAHHSLAYALTIFHQFRPAIDHATKAVASNPHDDEAWGVLSDSYVELGQYEKALDATQKMLDAKPSLAAYSRAANLRWIYGDPRGAMSMMAKAILAGAGYEEHVAWCRVQLGDMALKTGKTELAREQYALALKATPNSKPAHAGMARLLRSEGDRAGAIRHFEIATAGMTQIPYLSELGDLYRADGRNAEAVRAHRRIEELVEEHLSIGIEGDELNLASFWLDHDMNLAQALTLAESEIKEHTSVQAYSTLAWAYYKNGRYAEAGNAMTQALRHGTQDAALWARAAKIRIACGDSSSAQQFASKALAINPTMDDPEAHRLARGS